MDEHPPIDIAEKVKSRVLKEDKAHPLKKSKKNDNAITSKFIIDCLNSNELGDGLLYAAHNQKKFKYNKSSGQWMIWAGHYWEIDYYDQALSAVETICDLYLSEARRCVDMINIALKEKKDGRAAYYEEIQKRIYKRVNRLRSERGRQNTLKFAHTNSEIKISIKADELDQKPFLLGVSNGVIDLRTGTFRPGQQDDLISIISPIEWKGIDCPAPRWESFLLEIFEKDLALIDFLARLFGYAITGSSIDHIFPILIGQGRNGKGTIVETLMHIMGDLASPIPAEMLLDQGRARNSAGPTPDIMTLRGLRMAFASETDENRRFSHSRVKWLTGGDKLTGRHPHDRIPSKWLPTHTLFFSTNHEPQAQSDDFAFWERAFIIPFRLSYVDRKPVTEFERPADKHLPGKLIAEASGILAWLARGCLAWQRQGLDPPPIVIKATHNYRRDEDVLQDFLDEICFLDPAQEISASHIFTAFQKWWVENMSKNSPSQKSFGKMMKRRFKRQKKGTYVYYGVGLLSELNI